MSKVLSEART
nr:unnamed protein product [Callosobruchus chinensis]